MDQKQINKSVAVAQKAWNSVKKNIETFDPHVAQKQAPFLSRLYHAINWAFPQIISKIKAGKIDPFVNVKSTRYGPEMGSAKLHAVTRPMKVGFFPVASNPLWWGHILVALIAQAQLELDTVVFRVQGEIRYKDFPETDRVPVKDRHEVTKQVLTPFFPLFRYTDLTTEPDNQNEGAQEGHRYLSLLNKDKKVHLFYLLGIENQERVIRYLNQQYQFAKEFKFDQNPKHQWTINWIQRGDYAKTVTAKDLNTLGEPIRKKWGIPYKLPSRIVRGKNIDLLVSSTYYRNTHDAAIVPPAVDRHAKAHGYYGNPPIDPRTGKPYDYSEEEHFKIKLRPITEGVANQIVRLVERQAKGKIFVVGIDGPSGSGKTTIALEVMKFLKLRGYQSAHIPFDIFLKKKDWRSGMEKQILGQPLTTNEKRAVGSKKVKSSKKFYGEEAFWNLQARQRLVKQLSDFRKSNKNSATLIVKNGYDRLSKTRKTFRFNLKKGMIVIIDGKYCHREELSLHYDLHYRLVDNPDRTKAKFEIRTRTLSPNTADSQMKFYEVGLIPSYERYAKRTTKAIKWIIDLFNDNWRLKTN